MCPDFHKNTKFHIKKLAFCFLVWYNTIRNLNSGGPLPQHGTNAYRRLNMKGLVEAIEKEGMKESVPAFNVGDTVKVGFKVIEGAKERIQNFEGVVIAKKHGGIRESFTVRRMSFGVGVERTFPVHSPKIAYITVVKRGKVRRAKLYYLRGLTGKAAKITEIK